MPTTHATLIDGELLSIMHKIIFKTAPITGAPNVNFRKISVQKTIRDLEFSEHLL